MSEKTTRENLREHIIAELNLCDGSNTPFLCANISNPEDTEKMVDLVEKYVYANKCTISEAMLAVENDFNPNFSPDSPYFSA